MKKDGNYIVPFTEGSVIAHVQLLHDLGYEVTEEKGPPPALETVGLADVLIRYRESVYGATNVVA